MGRRVPVFAVRLGEDPYGFIGRFQAFNGNGRPRAALALELFECFVKHSQLQRDMSDVTVGLFEASNNYMDARSRVNNLELLEFWDQTYSDRVLEALKQNSQVSGAFGVRKKVEALVQKWGASNG